MKKSIVSLFVIFVNFLPFSYAEPSEQYPDPSYLPTKFILAGACDEKIELKDGLDIHQLDLNGIQIHREYRILRNINFQGSDLSNANLEETIFDNCSFREACLYGVTFNPFPAAVTCDFSNALIATPLSSGFRAGLTKEQLISTRSYQEKNLQRIILENSNFRGMDFSGCNLSNTCFRRCRMKNCNFDDARIEGCQFFFVIWFFADFSDEKPKPSAVWLKELGRSEKEFDFNIEQLLVTKDFKEGEVVNVSFNRVNWPNRVVDLSNMVFVNCHLGWSDTSAKIDLTDSVISKCNFEYFHGLTLENVKSTWNYKHNRMEGIKLPEEIQKALDAEKKK